MMYHGRLGAVWVLLAAAAAVEVYDDLAPELDGEIAYQDTNYIDTGPFRELHGDDTGPTRLKDPLLFRLIKSLRGELLPEHSYRMHEDISGDIPMLGKRVPQPGARQPRWKSKKGKVIGSQMVCYFKLCAFRNPS